MRPSKAVSILVFSIALAILVSACASAVTSSTLAPAATALPTGKYDGQWAGSGTTSDGKQITVTFTVQDTKITAMSYRFSGKDGLPCQSIAYDAIPATNQPVIANERFDLTPGTDVSLQANFSSTDEAFGHILIDWVGRHLTCNGQYAADWSATRKQNTVAAAETNVTNTLCGNAANCVQILIQLLFFGLSNGAVLALNAIGITVIYSTVRTLNLAHGDVFAMCTALVTSLINAIGVQQNWPPLLIVGILGLVLLAAILFGALLSMGIEWAAFRPFRGRSRLAPLIATLGLSFILYQGSLVWRTFQRSWIPGEHRSVPGLPEVPTDGIPDLLPHLDLIRAMGLNLHLVIQLNDLLVLAAAVGFAVGTSLLLNRTKLGLSLRSVSQNPTLAKIIGINGDQAIQRSFAVGGALAGGAAFIFALYYSRPFGSAGAESGLLAFAAALLGGIGSPIGALVSGLVMGVFSSYSDYFLSAQWTPVLLLILLIGLLVLRPTGLVAGDSDDSSEITLRDAVILTAPSQEKGRTQSLLTWLLVALGVVPLFLALFGLGGEILLKSISIYILLALGLNLLLGVAGVLDLGFVISFGVGAYATAILTDRAGIVGSVLPQPLDFTVILLISIIAAGIFGVIKGGMATRLRSDYLAVATLALGLLVQHLVLNLSTITGGASGIGVIPPPLLIVFRFVNQTSQYYLVFVAVVLAAMICQRLMQSRTGRAWLAGSEDEAVAESFGINMGGYRLLALVLSSVLAGVAGALYASTLSNVDPSLVDFNISVMTLAMVILGGAGSVPGAIIGALVIVGYDKVIVPQLATLLSFVWPKGIFIGPVPDIRGASFFNFGIALYLTVLFRARRKKDEFEGGEKASGPRKKPVAPVSNEGG